jgi:hypothetical protein
MNFFLNNSPKVFDNPEKIYMSCSKSFQPLTTNHQPQLYFTPNICKNRLLILLMALKTNLDE